MLVVSETTACWYFDCWSWRVMMCGEVYVSESESVVQAQTQRITGGQTWSLPVLCLTGEGGD